MEPAESRGRSDGSLEESAEETVELSLEQPEGEVGLTRPDDSREILVREKKVAVFWRRLIALVVDFVLLGLAGFFLGLFLGPVFVRMGGWAKLVGFAIAFAYFVSFNSRHGDGQTIGKRLLKVRVVNHEGGMISPALSALRFIVLAVPFFLNGTYVNPGKLDLAVAYILGLAVFGIGGGVVYFYVFNRKTRQSLHDIICNTYVVRAESKGAPVSERVGTVHFIVYSVFLICLTGFLLFGVPKLMSNEFFTRVGTIQRAVTQVEGIVTADVTETKHFNFGGETSESMRVVVYLDEIPESFEGVIRAAAQIVAETDPEFDKKNIVTVAAVYGYDIGIWSSWRTYFYSYPPQQWKQELVEDKKLDI